MTAGSCPVGSVSVGALNGVLMDGGPTNWLPNKISGLQLWLAADRGLALVDGNPVGTWPDQSGNGLDLSQATAAKKPTYKTNTLSAKPVVRFDGTDDSLTRGSLTMSSIFGTNEADCFIVMLQDGASADNALFDIDAPDFNNRYALSYSWSNVFYYDFGDAAVGGRINVAQPAGWDDAYHIVESYRATDGTGEIVVDGTEILSDTFTDALDITQTATFILSGADTTPANPLKGDIAEIIIYNRGLSATERGKVEIYLSDKYGITLT